MDKEQQEFYDEYIAVMERQGLRIPKDFIPLSRWR